MKLSIIMMAYNQASFIEEAINSVFSQDLPFEWELLIGDDCSLDNTKEIVLSSIRDYDNVRYIKNLNNLGLHKNYQNLVSLAKGDFIALLEADDYWIDVNKCRLQIELMEEDPKISWSFTNGIIVNENKELIKEVKLSIPTLVDLDYYIKNFFNPLSNTIIFRKTSEPKEYPDFFFEVRQWDTVLNYLRLLTNEGSNNKIGFIPLNGLGWRRHRNATSLIAFSGPERYKDWLIINREIKKRVQKSLKKYFNKDYVAYEYICLFYWTKKDILKFIKYFSLMLIFKPNRPILEYRDFFWKIRNNRIS